MTLRIGLIGCGKQAPKHISGLKADPDVDVVVFDMNAAAAQAVADKHVVTVADSLDAIFADDTITAIDICTPVEAHLDLILRATAAGKDYFCEKPLCHSVDEARQIEAATNAAGRIGMVGFNYRFAPAMQETSNVMMDARTTGFSPVLGRVTSGFMRVGGRGGHQLWKHKLASGGGAINEMMVHMVDLFLAFYGPIAHVDVLDKRLVRASRPVGGTVEEVDAEDFLLVKLTSKMGVSVICQADLITPSFIHYVDIQGENGNLFASVQPEMPDFVYVENSAGGYEKGRTDLNFGPRNFFEAQMAAFLSAIRSRNAPVSGTVADSVEIMRVLDEIRRA